MGCLVGWDGQAVNDLFELVSAIMPEDNPGSLRRSEYVDVLAYFFSLNSLPSGEIDMKDDEDSLMKIRIKGLDGDIQEDNFFQCSI